MSDINTINYNSTLLSLGGGGAAGGAGSHYVTYLGSFVNAGSGWNSYTYADGQQHTGSLVILTPHVEVKEVTATGFLYRCLIPKLSIAVNSSSTTTTTTEELVDTADPILVHFELRTLPDAYVAYVLRRELNLPADQYGELHNIFNDPDALAKFQQNARAMRFVQQSASAYEYFQALMENDDFFLSWVLAAAGLSATDYADFSAVAASETAMTAVAASETAMTAVAASETAMTAVCASAVARQALYDNAAVTEPLLAASPVALAAMRASTQYVSQVSISETYGVTLYSGKAFVLQVWNSGGSSSYTHYHGTYVVGDAQLSRTMSTSRSDVNKFASTVTGGQNTGSKNAVCAEFFKI